MPEYMLLLHGGKFDHFTPEELREVSAAYMRWLNEMRTEGRGATGAPLADERTFLKGDCVSDGPFAETKEAIGGYYTLTAADDAEAARLSATCPHLAYGGTIEICRIIEI